MSASTTKGDDRLLMRLLSALPMATPLLAFYVLMIVLQLWLYHQRDGVMLLLVSLAALLWVTATTMMSICLTVQVIKAPEEGDALENISKAKRYEFVLFMALLITLNTLAAVPLMCWITGLPLPAFLASDWLM